MYFVWFLLIKLRLQRNEYISKWFSKSEQKILQGITQLPILKRFNKESCKFSRRNLQLIFFQIFFPTKKTAYWLLKYPSILQLLIIHFLLYPIRWISPATRFLIKTKKFSSAIIQISINGQEFRFDKNKKKDTSLSSSSSVET